jgi:hypothetical protein
MKKNSVKFKQMQRDRILITKPWLKSTGAKTVKGKERSKMNAQKPRSDLDDLLDKINLHLKQVKELNKRINTSL